MFSHQLLAHNLNHFSGCLEKKAANNFQHFTFPNTTNYCVVFFSLIGSLILSQQLLHSLVLALFLVLYTNADRDIGCVLTQDSTLSSFRSAQPTSRVSKAKLMRSDSYKAREWCCSFTLESFNMVPSTECSNTFNNDLR